MPYTRKKAISFEEKLAIVRRYRSGESLSALNRQTGYQRQQIKKWAAREDAFQSSAKTRQRSRLSGAGSKPKFPQIEDELYSWFQSQRKNSLQVNYRLLRRKAREMGDNHGVTEADFPISDCWLHSFCRRHRITSRRITHRGQQDNRSAEEIGKVAVEWLRKLQTETAPFSADHIFNMDETPAYFDMSADSTLHFKGDKNVDGLDCGNRKTRFTVVLCASACGKLTPTMIIFKGLKNVPKLNLPRNIHVRVSEKGSMNTLLMKEWQKCCFSSRGSYLANSPSLVILDSYGTHCKEEIQREFTSTYKSEVLILPPRTTSFLQPIDVGVNYPFKAALKRHWDTWFQSGPQEFTPKGYRRRPSYQDIVDMVSLSLKEISERTIVTSFECCGISEKGLPVPSDKLNGRLKLLTESADGLLELQDSDCDDGDSDSSDELEEDQEDDQMS